MVFKKRTLADRFVCCDLKSINPRSWKITDKEKKSQNFRYYRVKKILYNFISFQMSRKPEYDPEIHGEPKVRKSKKGIDHITWYRPDLGITISLCWFCGSQNRNFRGWKVFWPYPSRDSQKMHFEIPCKIHDPETDLPAKVQIEMAERAVSRWVMDPDSFPGYRKIAVYQKGKFE